MAYRVEWRTEAQEELRSQFSKKHQRAVIRKVEHFAANLPASLGLKTVQPIRNAPPRPDGGRAFELDIGAGPRAALVVFEPSQKVVVYLVGGHDYAYSHYLSALERRMP